MSEISKFKCLPISRDVLNQIDCSDDKGLNALMLYATIQLHHEMAKDWLDIKNEWTTSLDSLFVNTKIKLSKEDKSKLVEALQYLNDLKIIYTEAMPKGFAKEFVINPNKCDLAKGKSYMLVRVDEFHRILNGKLAEVRQELALYIFYVSTVDGTHVHQSLADLAERLTDKQYCDSDDCSAWLVGMKKEKTDELLEVVCWWSLEDITTHTHSKDERGNEWITRPTLSKVLKRLDKKGIITTVTVKCKGFANKLVLCKSEHKPLIEAYYERKDDQAKWAWYEENYGDKSKTKTKKNKQNETQEQQQERQSITQKSKRDRKNRRFA